MLRKQRKVEKLQFRLHLNCSIYAHKSPGTCDLELAKLEKSCIPHNFIFAG